MLLGVDVGGTFTDAALLAGDRLVTGKAPTTPADQSEGVMEAVEEALGAANASAGDVERFVHGMTVGTNALLEGKVARTALLATEGFTDLEELGRQARAELYRLCAGHPPPLVPPELRVAGAKPCRLIYAATSNSSSRCLCEGQYLLPGSGTRWQGVPLRVLAWQHSGLPSKVTPSRACWSTYSRASST